MPDPDVLMDQIVDAFIGLVSVGHIMTRLMWEYNVPPQTLMSEIMKRMEIRAKEKGLTEQDLEIMKRGFEAGIKGRLADTRK